CFSGRWLKRLARSSSSVRPRSDEGESTETHRATGQFVPTELVMAAALARTVIRRTVRVPVDPGRAFDLFTDGLDSWWPREYTWAGETLEVIGIEPGVGGHCFERGPHGFRCDWGR